jgi:hypothetical protein
VKKQNNMLQISFCHHWGNTGCINVQGVEKIHKEHLFPFDGLFETHSATSYDIILVARIRMSL